MSNSFVSIRQCVFRDTQVEPLTKVISTESGGGVIFTFYSNTSLSFDLLESSIIYSLFFIERILQNEMSTGYQHN